MMQSITAAVDAAVEGVRAEYKAACSDLTRLVQHSAKKSGWPREAWTALYVEFSDDAYELLYHPRGKDAATPQDGGPGIDVVRKHEFGFDGSEPMPVAHRFLNRVERLADGVIAQKRRHRP